MNTFIVQKHFIIFQEHLLSHVLSKWVYYAKIVKLAIDKITKMEIRIDFHIYRPDISCDPDRLRERVKIFQYILIIFLQIWQHLECPEVKVEFCPGFLIIIFLIRTCLASSFVIWNSCFLYHWNTEHISWQNLSWSTDCLPVDRQVLKPTFLLLFLQECQPEKWILR
jgi:hypothetical protein